MTVMFEVDGRQVDAYGRDIHTNNDDRTDVEALKAELAAVKAELAAVRRLPRDAIKRLENVKGVGKALAAEAYAALTAEANHDNADS